MLLNQVCFYQRLINIRIPEDKLLWPALKPSDMSSLCWNPLKWLTNIIHFLQSQNQLALINWIPTLPALQSQKPQLSICGNRSDTSSLFYPPKNISRRMFIVRIILMSSDGKWRGVCSLLRPNDCKSQWIHVRGWCLNQLPDFTIWITNKEQSIFRPV